MFLVDIVSSLNSFTKDVKCVSTLKVIIILLLGGFLVACKKIELEDVSHDPKYKALIDKCFRIKEDVWVTAVTLDKNYKKQVNKISLVPGVGFTGPEVVWREHFGKNEIIQVTRVLTPKSSLLSGARYIVKFKSTDRYDRYSGVDIDAHPNTISTRKAGSIDNPNFGFDKAIYELTDCL